MFSLLPKILYNFDPFSMQWSFINSNKTKTLVSHQKLLDMAGSHSPYRQQAPKVKSKINRFISATEYYNTLSQINSYKFHRVINLLAIVALWDIGVVIVALNTPHINSLIRFILLYPLTEIPFVMLFLHSSSRIKHLQKTCNKYFKQMSRDEQN